MSIQKLMFAVVATLAMSSAAQAACKAGDSYKDQTVDCGGATIGLSCKDDGETQPPVLTLNNATVKNVVISATGGSDGIHCTGGTCTLTNVTWKEVCEDAASVIADGAKMVVSGGSAVNTASTDSSLGGRPDKFFQINNANTSLTIKDNFTATIAAGSITDSVGKLARSCGDCSVNTGPRTIVVNNVNVKGKIGAVVGVNAVYKDSSSKVTGKYDTATITNLRVENYKIDSSNKSTPPICEEWIGVQKGKGTSDKNGSGPWWNTTSCVVKTTDVSKL